MSVITLKSGKLEDVWKAILGSSGQITIDLSNQTYKGSVTGLHLTPAPGTRSFVGKEFLIDRPEGITIRNGTLDLGHRYGLLSTSNLTLDHVTIIGEGFPPNHSGLYALVRASGPASNTNLEGCTLCCTADAAVHTLLVDRGATCHLADCQVEHSGAALGAKVAGGKLIAAGTTFTGAHSSLLGVAVVPGEASQPPAAPPAPAAAPFPPAAAPGEPSGTADPPAEGKAEGSSSQAGDVGATGSPEVEASAPAASEQPAAQGDAGSATASILALDYCKVICANGTAGPSIGLTGGSTQLTARRTKVEGGCAGVLASKRAAANLIKCDVSGAHIAGVWSSDGQVTAAGTNFKGNRTALLVERQGAAELQNCSFLGSTEASVVARGAHSFVRLVDCKAQGEGQGAQQTGGAVIVREDGIAAAFEGAEE